MLSPVRNMITQEKLVQQTTDLESYIAIFNLTDAPLTPEQLKDLKERVTELYNSIPKVDASYDKDTQDHVALMQLQARGLIHSIEGKQPCPPSPTHSLTGSESQFTLGVRDNFACTPIAMKALESLLQETPTQELDIDLILQDGTITYHTLLEKTEEMRTLTDAGVFFDTHTVLESNSFSMLSSTEFSNGDKGKTYVTNQNSFQSAVEELEEIPHTGSIGAVITYGGSSFSIAIRINANTEQKEYLLFDSHGGAFSLGSNKAVLHSFKTARELSSFIAKTLSPEIEETNDAVLADVLRRSSIDAIPHDFSLTPIVLKS